MNTQQETMEHFIKANQITATVKPGAKVIPDNFADSDAWTVTIKMFGKRMAVPFFMGKGHNGKQPDLADVLDCLASDAASYDGNDFDTWCGDLGYDADSRKAERTYKAIERQSLRLHRFLGADLYSRLVYDVERL